LCTTDSREQGPPAGEPFDQIVNHSILQTFGRSINTSLTVVVTLTALLLFAGASIHYFVLALLIGIISGTYSSIFNASPLWWSGSSGKTTDARSDWRLCEAAGGSPIASQAKPGFADGACLRWLSSQACLARAPSLTHAQVRSLRCFGAAWPAPSDGDRAVQVQAGDWTSVQVDSRKSWIRRG